MRQIRMVNRADIATKPKQEHIEIMQAATRETMQGFL